MSELQLIEAVKARNLSKAGELIESGTDVNEQDAQGWTPLNWAAGKGDTEMVRLLTERGADVFKVGRDLRTPYLIALAAGHAEVVKFLRQAEDSVEGEKPQRPVRQYCKAYHLKDLRLFTAWSESRINWKAAGKATNGDGPDETESLRDEDIVFVHQDYTVTRSMWHNEDVIFERVSSQWEEFCSQTLEFRVPDDLDLIVSVRNIEGGNASEQPNA